MKTADYVLTEDYSYFVGQDTVVVTAGTFVRPIEYKYLPKHVIEDDRWAWTNKTDCVFCYFRKGIVPFPRKILRQV